MPARAAAPTPLTASSTLRLVTECCALRSPPPSEEASAAERIIAARFVLIIRIIVRGCFPTTFGHVIEEIIDTRPILMLLLNPSRGSNFKSSYEVVGSKRVADYPDTTGDSRRQIAQVKLMFSRSLRYLNVVKGV